MGTRIVGNAALLACAIVILFLAKIHQRPQCINSSLIEKITLPDQSSVYKCALNKTVPYSIEFQKRQWLLESELIPFESWVKSYFKVRGPRIQLEIVKEPTMTRSEGRKIIVWEKSLDQSWNLQREMIQILLNQSGLFKVSQDTLADFYVRVWNQNKQAGFGNLSSYISHQWWMAYKNIKIQHKHAFLQKLPSLFQNQFLRGDSQYDQVTLMYNIFLKNQADVAILSFWNNLEKQTDYQNSYFKAQFDYLLLTPDLRSGAMAKFNQLQKNYPKLSLGVWDGKSLYHVQSRSYMSVSAFREIKAHRYMWESCDDLELQSLLDMPAKVRKLLVVRNCKGADQPNYQSYIEDGIQGFAAANPKIPFVSLDIPSLNSKKDAIRLQAKIFDLMSHRQINDSFFVALGWQELQLNQKLQMYVPKAYVDAIESFRVTDSN